MPPPGSLSVSWMPLPMEANWACTDPPQAVDRVDHVADGGQTGDADVKLRCRRRGDGEIVGRACRWLGRRISLDAGAVVEAGQRGVRG